MPIVTHDMNDCDMLSLHFSGASVYAVGILNLSIWFHESIHDATIQLPDLPNKPLYNWANQGYHGHQTLPP